MALQALSDLARQARIMLAEEQRGQLVKILLILIAAIVL